MRNLEIKPTTHNQIEYRGSENKLQWKVTPDGKLRGPVVNRAIAMFFTAGFLGGLLGSVAGRLL